MAFLSLINIELFFYLCLILQCHKFIFKGHLYDFFFFVYHHHHHHEYRHHLALYLSRYAAIYVDLSVSEGLVF